MAVLFWAILVRLYRNSYRVIFRTTEYVLTPSCRLYIFVIWQVLLVFLLIAFIRFWVAAFDLIVFQDPIIWEHLPNLYSSLYEYAVFLYTLFTAETDPWTNVDGVERFHQVDYYEYIYESAGYRDAQKSIDADFDAILEDYEEHETVYTEGASKERFKNIDQPERPSDPAFIQFLDDEEEFRKEFEDIIKDDFAASWNMLSSASRIYRSGFFEYSYEDPAPTDLFDFPYDLKSESVLYTIDTTDLDVDIEVIYDDIVRVTIHGKSLTEAQINTQGLHHNVDYLSEQVDTDDCPHVIGLENVERNFIRYANYYSDDILEDILDPNSAERSISYYVANKDILPALR